MHGTAVNVLKGKARKSAKDMVTYSEDEEELISRIELMIFQKVQLEEHVGLLLPALIDIYKHIDLADMGVSGVENLKQIIETVTGKPIEEIYIS